MKSKNTFFSIYGLLVIALGIYNIINQNFLDRYGTFVDVAWIDDYLFGFILFITGIALILTIRFNYLKIRNICLIAVGGELCCLASVYGYHAIIGNGNLTWILSIALFVLLVFFMFREE